MDEATREFVRQRASGRCEYCGLSQDVTPLIPYHIEHIIARQHGGSSTTDNLAISPAIGAMPTKAQTWRASIQRQAILFHCFIHGGMCGKIISELRQGKSWV